MQNPSERAGFTLVEVLLGLGICAIIGASVNNLFFSGIKLDDKLRRAHDNYLELLIADQVLTRDLENAVSLSMNPEYKDLKIFDGQQKELSFLTVTPAGIRRVRYFSGTVDWGNVTKVIIGKKVSRLSNTSFSKGPLPIEFLLRQESSLAQWANQSDSKPATQIVSAGLKKDTFRCSYVPFTKDLNISGSKGLDYTDNWDGQGLPMSVACTFTLYDRQGPKAERIFKKEFFLAPLWPNHENTS
jgi:type II secretory pathway component PulJ